MPSPLRAPRWAERVAAGPPEASGLWSRGARAPREPGQSGRAVAGLPRAQRRPAAPASTRAAKLAPARPARARSSWRSASAAPGRAAGPRPPARRLGRARRGKLALTSKAARACSLGAQRVEGAAEASSARRRAPAPALPRRSGAAGRRPAARPVSAPRARPAAEGPRAAALAQVASPGGALRVALAQRRARARLQRGLALEGLRSGCRQGPPGQRRAGRATVRGPCHEPAHPSAASAGAAPRSCRRGAALAAAPCLQPACGQEGGAAGVAEEGLKPAS